MLPELYRRPTSLIERLLTEPIAFGTPWQDAFGGGNFEKQMVSRWSHYEDRDKYAFETLLPEGVNVGDIVAEVQEGVLRITVPKPAAQRIDVQTKQVEQAGERELAAA